MILSVFSAVGWNVVPKVTRMTPSSYFDKNSSYSLSNSKLNLSEYLELSLDIGNTSSDACVHYMASEMPCMPEPNRY